MRCQCGPNTHAKPPRVSATPLPKGLKARQTPWRQNVDWGDEHPMWLEHERLWMVKSEKHALKIAYAVARCILEHKDMTEAQKQVVGNVTFWFRPLVHSLAKFCTCGNKVVISTNLLPCTTGYLIDTVKHELSHAAVGAREMHSGVWLLFFLLCGGTGEVRGTMHEAAAPYSLECPNVQNNTACFKAPRHKLMRNIIRRQCCPNCKVTSGAFVSLRVIDTATGEVVDLTKKRKFNHLQ